MSGFHHPLSQREQDGPTRSRKDRNRRDSSKKTLLGDNDSTRPYLPQTPELLSQDSWAIEKQFIAEQRLQLHQPNGDIQKLGDEYTNSDQKGTVLDERLRAPLWCASRLLEDNPISPSTTSGYTHLNVPSPAIYEILPWVWPPSMDQCTLGVMTDDQTKTNNAILHECAPAVAQPKTSIELVVHMVEGAEGEDQDYQSDASSSTVSLFSQPARPLSPYSDLKPTSTSKTRRGRHSGAIDQELDTYRKRPSSDSETDDSPTGMYIPVVIHDKARGFRRRTK